MTNRTTPDDREFGQVVVDSILEMARDNPTWGYRRVQGALANLGFNICKSTIANVLKQHGVEPAPDRGRSMKWSTFLKAHWNILAAIDFTNVEVWTAGGLPSTCYSPST